jgi:hypothetical protein
VSGGLDARSPSSGTAGGAASSARRLIRVKCSGVSFVLSAAFLVGACASFPKGPSLLALPGTGKSRDQFNYDDVDCRNFADAQIGGATPSDVANSTAAKSAVIGTAIGAGVGAAFGGGGGAAVGAGFGLLTGAAVGASSGEASAYALQRRYDNAYVQCMYSKGHKVPVSGRMTSTPPAYAPPPPPPPPSTPPPPSSR